MRRFFIVALSFALCFSIIGSTAHALEPMGSVQIVSTSATLTRISGDRLSICYTIRATKEMDIIGASSIEIQRLSGTNWATEYTFTTTETPELQVSKTDYHSLILEYTPEHSKSSYRAVVHFYATSSLGTSTKTGTTDPV